MITNDPPATSGKGDPVFQLGSRGCTIGKDSTCAPSANAYADSPARTACANKDTPKMNKMIAILFLLFLSLLPACSNDAGSACNPDEPFSCPDAEYTIDEIEDRKTPLCNFWSLDECGEYSRVAHPVVANMVYNVICDQPNGLIYLYWSECPAEVQDILICLEDRMLRGVQECPGSGFQDCEYEIQRFDVCWDARNAI
jgi:hypothetical protein